MIERSIVVFIAMSLASTAVIIASAHSFDAESLRTTSAILLSSFAASIACLAIVRFRRRST